ncbi:MAG: RNA polymerase sigma factor, partial [Butyrivibrio sp.]
VYRYLLSVTHDEALAEELTQETFYQAVKSVNKFDGSCKVSTWLCAIARNSLYKYYKKHPVCEELDEQRSAEKSVEDSLIQKETHMELLRGIHSLDEETREVMYLRIYGNLSFREIGEIMSKTENWARVIFYRGKEKLKKEMNRYGE